MRTSNKAFHLVRTAFFGLIFVFAGYSNALAASSLFTVNGVKVDVTAESAVSAREQAFDQAQQKAFSVLAERMLQASEYENFEMPQIDIISALVQDFEVRNEKLSRVRYTAAYNFRFKDGEVKEFFSGNGLSFTDVSAQAGLILPYYFKRNQTLLWSPFNVWMRAWNRASDLENGLVPLLVPLGDVQDVRDIREEDGLEYSQSRLDRLLGRYGAGEAIILLALPSENLALVEGEGDAATGSLDIKIYRTDRGYAEFVQNIIIQTTNTDTLGSVMDRAVEEVQSALRQNWKQKTVTHAQQNAALEAEVHFNSLQEWAKMQRSIRNVYGIDTVSIKALTPKQAKLILTYQGDFERLRLALEQARITIIAPESSPMLHYYPGAEMEQKRGAYELRFKDIRYAPEPRNQPYGNEGAAQSEPRRSISYSPAQNIPTHNNEQFQAATQRGYQW